jgi:hypothetical protein
VIGTRAGPARKNRGHIMTRYQFAWLALAALPLAYAAVDEQGFMRLCIKYLCLF